MKRAIFLVDDSPDMKGAFEKLFKTKEETEQHLDKVMVRMNAAKKGCWQTVEDILLGLGKIENTDVNLRYKDGCIFIVDEFRKDCNKNDGPYLVPENS